MNVKLSQLVTASHVTATLKGDQGTDAELVTWNVGNIIDKGDNSGSDVKKITVTYSKENQERNVSYVVKINPAIEEFSDFNSLSFEKEVGFFTTIVPKLTQELHSAGEPPLRIARCFLTDTKKGEEMLFLEDMSLRGFTVYDRKKGLDVAHASLVLQELARMHASSILLQQCTKENITDKYKFLQGHHYGDRERFKMAISGNFEVTIAMLEHIGGYEKAVNWIKRNKFSAMKVMDDMIGGTPPFNVMCHGDCWTNNLLFRYDEKGHVVEASLLDFQTIFMASLAVDLNYFLIICTDGAVRKANTDWFLTTYYETLKRIVEAGGVQLPFTLQELTAEYRSKHRYVLHFAMMFIPLNKCDVLEFEVLDNLQRVKSEETVKKMSQNFIHLLEKYPEILPNFTALFDEFEEAGVFD